MYLIVFFGDKPVYLCNEIDPAWANLKDRADTLFVRELSDYSVRLLIQEIARPEIHAGILLYSDFDKLCKAFFAHFTLITAAGGIVENEAGQLLFIFRRGVWDLPKGKVDEGEYIEDAALREVEEETAATGLRLGNKLGETYHTYRQDGEDILKTTHWFHMTCAGNPSLKPQEEEQITDIRWVGKEELNAIAGGSYASIREILRVFAGDKS